jgi:uncharacterized protein (TIGR02996 family)
MNPERAFLHAMLDDPDDDTVRLVYADFLEDRGNPRGELIRVQCQLAAWEPDLARRTELQRREQELIEAHATAWLGPLRADCTDFEFRRGLLRVTMPVPRFLRRRSAKGMRQLLSRAGVETVRLTGTGEELAALPGAPPLGAVTSLDLSGNQLDDDFIRALSQSPHLGALTRLDLSNNQIGNGVQGLHHSPLRERLTRLDLRNNRITSNGAVALLASGREFPHCRPDLRGNDLGRESAFLKFIHGDGTAARPINSLGMEFALIPAGTFLMGSPDTEATRKSNEGPQRPITLTRPFYFGVYEVTQQEFEWVMGANHSEFTAAYRGGPSHPAENVNWDDAVQFCRRLSELPAEREAGRVYRLPTEAEWEYACRAGTTTAFHYGRGLSSHQANMHGGQPYFAPPGTYLERTTPVGSYRPNAFGLYDMHGNVWEWCADCYDDRYFDEVTATDPVGPDGETNRSQRGGCWGAYGECCRSAYRGSDPPDRRLNCIGMRVGMTVG